MKDLKEFILEKRIRELKVDGKKVPDKYIAVFNDYLVEIAELIKVHDRELVKEVCEKIREFENSKSNSITNENGWHNPIRKGMTLNEFLDQIQIEVVEE